MCSHVLHVCGIPLWNWFGQGWGGGLWDINRQDTEHWRVCGGVSSDPLLHPGDLHGDGCRVPAHVPEVSGGVCANNHTLPRDDLHFVLV